MHLWHLSSTSPCVRLAANTLAPVRCFLAHDVGVMAISWSWGDAAHFATGGMDNLVRLWHADDTRLPLSSVPGQSPVSCIQTGSVKSKNIDCTKLPVPMSASSPKQSTVHFKYEAVHSVQYEASTVQYEVVHSAV